MASVGGGPAVRLQQDGTVHEEDHQETADGAARAGSVDIVMLRNTFINQLRAKTARSSKARPDFEKHFPLVPAQTTAS